MRTANNLMMRDHARKRSGQIVALFALLLVVLVIICVLSIDMGRMITSQAQLQNAVDAAALAGASQLIGFVDEPEKTAARQEAVRLSESNAVAGDHLTLATEDIQFGRYDDDTGQFVSEDDFASGERIDSMLVRGRRSEDAPDGVIGLFFAGIFGIHGTAQGVQAVATQPRRYVVFVMDRSGSMCFDTTNIDLYSAPNSDASMDPTATGWYWMPKYIYKDDSWRTAWMYAVDDDTGDVVTDFLPDHIKARLSGSNFRYCSRDRPNNVQSGWLKVPSGITIYSAYGDEYLYWYADSYGPVGSCDYAIPLDPIEPMASSQNAAVAFVDLLDPEKNSAALVTYAWQGTLDNELTTDFEALREKITAYDARGATATPDGMEVGIDEFVDSGRADGLGQRILILLTDGLANVAGGTTYGNPSSKVTVTFFDQEVECYIYQTVASAIETQTRRARNNGIRIYTVSFGNGADQDLMPLIAQETNGAYYYAPNHSSLTDVFTDIFHNLPPVLTW